MDKTYKEMQKMDVDGGAAENEAHGDSHVL